MAQKREEEEEEEEEEDQDDQEDEVFYGYGFFYVRLFCPGFGFQANIVEEHVLFCAFILLANVRLYVNACYAVASDVAALVVVTAVACLLLVMLLSPFFLHCREAGCSASWPV